VSSLASSDTSYFPYKHQINAYLLGKDYAKEINSFLQIKQKVECILIDTKEVALKNSLQHLLLEIKSKDNIEILTTSHNHIYRALQAF